MCDKTDEGKYDLEQKASKNVKEIEDLQKRVVDIKCEYEIKTFVKKVVKFLKILLSLLTRNERSNLLGL